MSIIPAKNVRLDLYEGSTFDEQWTFYEDDEITPVDLTGWSAALKVRSTYDAVSATLEVDSTAFTPGPGTKGIELGDIMGTVRIYVGSTPMAALNESGFTARTLDDGSVEYAGVWDLELTNPAGEVFRYAMGTAIFWPEATW